MRCNSNAELLELLMYSSSRMVQKPGGLLKAIDAYLKEEMWSRKKTVLLPLSLVTMFAEIYLHEGFKFSCGAEKNPSTSGPDSSLLDGSLQMM